MNDDQLASGIKRAFGRYRMAPRSIEELAVSAGSAGAVLGADAAVARPPLLARRRMLGGLSLAGVAVAVAVAFAFTFGIAPGGGKPQSVWAGWQPTPTKPDETMRAQANTTCRGTLGIEPLATVPGSTVMYDSLPLVVQDQRGAVAMFVFGDGTTFFMCLMWPNGTGGYDAVGSTMAAPPHPMLGHLELESVGQDGVLTSPGWIQIVRLYGRTDASEVAVTRADGVEVHATVSNNVFVAWWPGQSSPVSVVAYDGAGRSIAAESMKPLWTPTPCICEVQPASPVPAN